MSSRILQLLTQQPFTQLRKNRYFYLYYDGGYAIACAFAILAMKAFDWKPWLSQRQELPVGYLILLPFLYYAHILASVFVHNASHGSFPRWVNRLVGEICGLIVLTRFASWQIVHVRHHTYSDQRDKDPHPVDPHFWHYFFKTFATVEQQLMQGYYDLFGHTKANRRYERKRAYVSYASNVLLVLAWYYFLGDFIFWTYFFPASLLGILHIQHFNWSTHNGANPQGPWHPINLNEGWFYWGNKLFFGIYMHANHHHNSKLFNPARMKPVSRKKAPLVLQTS